MARRDPRFSYLATVSDVLRLVRDQAIDTSDNPNTVAARAKIPDRLVHTQRFMAWEVYYKNPKARETALAALIGVEE